MGLDVLVRFSRLTIKSKSYEEVCLNTLTNNFAD